MATSLARGALLNLAAKLLTLALGLAVMVLVARRGPQVQGAFALFATVESALLTLGSGPGLWLAREVSHHRRAAPPRLSAALILALGLGAFGGLVLLAITMARPRPPYDALWLLVPAAPFLLLANTASGLWLGQGRMAALNAPLVAAPALMLAGLGLGAWLWPEAGLLGVLLAWVAAKTLVGWGSAAFALAGPGWAPPDTAALRGQTRFMAVIGLTNLVSLGNYRVSLFLVEHHLGVAATGVYAVAVQVAELLWVLSSSVTLSAYHRIGGAQGPEAARTTLRAALFSAGVTFAVAPLLLAVAHFALPSVLGPAYAASLRPLALLLPGVAAYAAASGLSAYFTNHCGRPQWSTGIAGLSLVINAALGAWAAPRWGLSGVALATSLAYGLAIVVALRSFLRTTGLRWRDALPTAADPALRGQSGPR